MAPLSSISLIEPIPIIMKPNITDMVNFSLFYYNNAVLNKRYNRILYTHFQGVYD
jgi:hypothetical protein